ncbi:MULTISPECIES: MmgE/PrpD family protein [unclassified Paraburkholderia]|uniref:MmgE/PrpD family protein n=1 Tax=unclassified Paraburkholderia TaxID=2615204 RepID=UPI001610940E|nr:MULTISPECIES: MmgE/PrpD family protein [unclassified Paraburkholderia]MBB5446945.1 2-methylcitrate dehydratase PrpD [Paraburkholderia sp. WSM4177]MBB5487403.1 2-methylcitrate dehydratase PrpD [Paraburkholderia sp. WSM4180]
MNNPPPDDELSLQQSTIHRIASYVVEARGRRVSGVVRESALKRILDLLCAVGAGASEPGVVAIRATACRYLGSGDIPMWFTGTGSSVVGAAWANSAAASVLDLDDGHRRARGHPGAAVIPVAFAVAAEMGAGLEDLIASIVIGYEVGVSIAAARTTYGTTGTWSSYAVVATAAALRCASCSVVEHALAIAGESAPNSSFMSAPPLSFPTPESSDIKEGIPWSVVTGMLALDLAEGGFTGPRNILDSGLLYRFADVSPLGESLHICNAYYKLYCCCRHVHPPLEATLRLIEQYQLDAKAIEAIDIETYGGALRIANQTCPATLVDVQYSIPYCVALAALAGRESLLPLTIDCLTYEGVSALANKVSLTVDAEIDKQFPARTLARVKIVCGGRRYVSEVTEPRGEAGDSLSWEELKAKYVAATRFHATGAQQEQLLAAVEELRSKADLEPLKACMSTSFENSIARAECLRSSNNMIFGGDNFKD